MRGILAVAFIFVVGSGGLRCEIKWPDREISVPPLVVEFIAAECLDHFGATGSEWDACVESERAGYRATVMMLADPRTGVKAAERYRACKAGQWVTAGRFHRHKAQCIGASLGYIWRFKDTARA